MFLNFICQITQIYFQPCSFIIEFFYWFFFNLKILFNFWKIFLIFWLLLFQNGLILFRDVMSSWISPKVSIRFLGDSFLFLILAYFLKVIIFYFFPFVNPFLKNATGQVTINMGKWGPCDWHKLQSFVVTPLLWFAKGLLHSKDDREWSFWQSGCPVECVGRK